MSDVVDSVAMELVMGFPSVDPATVKQIASEFLAILGARADRDTRAALEALTACEDDGCITITALAREHDGRQKCPVCYRASKREERDAERIAATHGPEMRRLRS